jgi:hypothetical protein
MSLPLNILILIAILAVVNWVTFTGVWWAQWAALGLTIAWFLTVFRQASITWIHSRAAWWMKAALLVLVIAWVTTLIRAVRRALGL